MQTDTSSVDVDKQAGPPNLREIERLAAELQNARGAQPIEMTAGSSPGLLPVAVEQIALDLDALRIGNPPTDIDESIRQLLLALEKDWACQTTFSQFQERLRLLLEPLQKSTTDVRQFEEEVALRRERLETLRLLVELLDELICI